MLIPSVSWQIDPFQMKTEVKKQVFPTGRPPAGQAQVSRTQSIPIHLWACTNSINTYNFELLSGPDPSLS